MEQVEYETMAAVEATHWWYCGMRALSASWLDRIADGNMRVLDAGCGTGGNVEFLGRYGTAIGLDLSALALQMGQQRAAGRLTRGSVVALPFADHSFDLVTSFDVLYHRAVLDEDAALRETVRVLKPGGYLLIRLPAYRWLSSQHDRSVHGRHRYTASEARAMLQHAGMRIERLSYCNSLLFPLAVAQRLSERVQSDHGGSASEMAPPAPIVNTLLQSALYSEAAWLRRGGSFPWGLSILALARKEA